MKNYKKYLKNKALVDSLTELFFFNQPAAHADYSIVLGMNLWQRPISTAITLYHQGISGKLILCGGFNSTIQQEEATVMQQFALEKGIPPKDLMLDNVSLNTYENIANALNLLKTSKLDVDQITLNIISIHFHARRALLTAEKLFPTARMISTVTYPSIHYTAANWHQSETGILNVFSELNKLIRYFPDKIPTTLSELVPT